MDKPKRKVLVITNIFPNNVEPHSGAFNLYQFSALAEVIDLKVVAPVPWLLGTKIYATFKGFGRVGRVKFEENLSGLKVFHPKFYNIWAMQFLSGIIFFLSVFNTIRRISASFKFNLIIATWAYPDAFASLFIAKIFRVPFIVKVHGSDILCVKNPLIVQMIKYMLKRADRIICVSQDLKSKIGTMGITDMSKVYVLYNGTDLNEFKPIEKEEVRTKVNLPCKKQIITYIGTLKTSKGVYILLDAFLNLVHSVKNKNFHLIFLGEGPEKEKLRNKVKSYNLESAIDFLGVKPHKEVPLFINASDVIILPSFSEGVPNAILESLACGVPVVATRVGGIPEIVNSDEVGILVPPADAMLLTSALTSFFEKGWNRMKIRNHAKKFSWDNNIQIFSHIIESIIN